MEQQKNHPLVTVLMCAYNAELYIDESLNGVMTQTYPNLEIIIINDGSTDNTENIIKKYVALDKRISLVNNEENLGFIASLNKGLTLSNGKYLAKTDSDDIAKPHWIETLVNILENNHTILAIGSYLSIISAENNGSILAQNSEHGEEWKKPLTHEEIMNTMLFYNPMNNPSMIMRSDIYNKYGLFFNSNYQYAEDYKFWLEVSRLGKLANYPEALVYYRLHRDQTSSQYVKKQKAIAKKIRKEAINYYFSDLGIKQKIGETIIFDDIYHITREANNMNIKDRDLFENILYECYCSLIEYKFNDMMIFLLNIYNIPLRINLKRKILKRFLFPKKYCPSL